MKTRSLPVLTSTAIALSLLCFGIFQACVETPKGVGSAARSCRENATTICWEQAREINPKENDGKPVKGDEGKKNAVSKLLKKYNAKNTDLDFCVRVGTSSRDCKPVYKANFAQTSGIRTEQIDSAALEAGGGDGYVEGINVMQQVEFYSPEHKAAFIKDVDPEPPK
jgi:hypothetical protein